ncbi:hypothetical protein Cri9333_4606 [Crinalium epipsammum PCC 9333]|uniref:Uncharacterized protein n=1 Tax=Crinalium epipsammum PCC 9333 TaxID=1173022 RepID=K9W5B0_9CYAN|nr:hypothetical protein [Crinalium epipsammum]AFZ15386.1 hypothetical protein Cri9333_4606 [Crinalium epipsammum PCC 9333]
MVQFRGLSFNSSRLLFLAITVSITAPLGIYTAATAATFSDLPNHDVPLAQSTQARRYLVQVQPETQPAPDTSVDTIPNNRSNTEGNDRNNQELFSQKYKVSKNTIIKAAYRGADKLTLVPGQTTSLNVLITEDIKNSQGEVVIPKNSEIQGQLVSRYDNSTFIGVQFLSERLIIGNRLYNNINVTSPMLTDRQPVTYNYRRLGEAAVVTAAEVLVSKLAGYRINPVPIVTTIISNRPTRNQRQNDLIVIDLKKDLQLSFKEDFYMNKASGE